MKYLVTGCCGFIGTNLCLELVKDNNNEIYGIDNFINKRQEIAKKYDNKLEELNKYLIPLKQKCESAYHIYVIKLFLLQQKKIISDGFSISMAEMKARGP